MPRRRRLCPVGHPIHVIARGINRQLCFTCDADVAAYAHWLAEGASKFDVHLHGWVFMTNHVHLLLTPQQDQAASHLMQFLGRLYVRYFNDRYARSGGLFEGRFRSCLVQDELYFLDCLRYIELNPVRAGVARDPASYHWSSYAAHGLGKDIAMLRQHPVYLSLGDCKLARAKRYRALIKQALGAEVVANIRHCANRGLILGSQRFRSQFEHLTGHPHKVGDV